MRIVKASCQLRRRRRQGGAKVVGERLAAVAVRPRHLLSLIDADENAAPSRPAASRSLRPSASSAASSAARPGRRQLVAVALGLGPGIEQAVANDAMGLDLAEVGERARQGFGEIEQRIGARTERAQRQPRRRLAAQAWDDAGLEQRRLAGAGCARESRTAAGRGGAHLPQRFQRLRDLAAAAIEQRGVGIVVAERGEARERHRTQLAVDRERFRVEADAAKRAGFAQSCHQAVGDIPVRTEIERAVRPEAGDKVETLILRQTFASRFSASSLRLRPCRKQEQRDDAFAHVEACLELAETFVGREPVLGDETHHDPAGPGCRPQGLAPGVAARDAVVIDEHVGEAVGAQPRLQRRRRRVVLAGMAYEQDRHVPLTPPYAAGPKLTGSSKA